MVDNIAQLYSLKSPLTGVLVDEDKNDVMPQIFDTYDGIIGKFPKFAILIIGNLKLECFRYFFSI